MKLRTKWSFIVLIGTLLFLLSGCDPFPTLTLVPAPNCDLNYYVTKEADTNDWVCSALDCSLREAVLNANVCPGIHTIHLPAGGYTLTISGIDEDDGETGDLDIKDDLVIIGTGAPSIHGNVERSFQGVYQEHVRNINVP